MRGNNFINNFKKIIILISSLISISIIFRSVRKRNFNPFLVFLSIFCFCSSFLSLAANSEEAKRTKVATAQCLNLKPNHSSYQKAIDRIFSLKSVNEWQKEMKSERKSSYIPDLDKTEIFRGKCAWSIGIYQNKKDSLLLWKTFLLPINGKQIYVYSVSEDSYEVYTD